MQFIQKRKGELEIYLIKNDGYNEKIESRYKAHFEQSLLGKCKYQIIYSDEILREPNGKFLPLKQYIEE